MNMKISKTLQKFIENNINLIEQDTKESWEEIYSMDPPKGLAEVFIKLDCDPAEQLGYIPKLYLYDSNIKNYTIPTNVTSIGERAFSGCRKLEKLVIPGSISTIQLEAFAYSWFKSVEYRGTLDQWLKIDFRTYGSNPMNYTSKLYIQGKLLTHANIDNVTQIGDYQFHGFKSLKHVSISDSVTSIGNGAFIGCDSLESIEIPNSVTSIGEDAFYGCTSLTSVTIGKGVTCIGRDTFGCCTSLTSVEIGDNVALIDDAAFCDSGIKTIILGSNPLLHIARNAFYKSKLEIIEFKGTKKEVKKNGIGSISLKRWKETPTLKKIICTDGVIKL